MILSLLQARILAEHLYALNYWNNKRCKKISLTKDKIQKNKQIRIKRLKFSLGELTGKSLSTNQLPLCEDVTTGTWTICGTRGGDLKYWQWPKRLPNIDHTWTSSTKWLVNLTWKTDCKLNPWSRWISKVLTFMLKSEKHSCAVFTIFPNSRWIIHFPMTKRLSFLVKLVHKIGEKSLPFKILG